MITKKSNRPPRISRWLLYRLMHYQHDYIISGDLEEAFHEIVQERGYFLACLWFWYQTICCLPKYLKNQIYWGLTMFTNYLKVALRNFQRHVLYSVINIVGLALGMAGCLLIYLWVQDELSYDRYHKNAHCIYRVERDVNHQDLHERWPITSGPYGPTLMADYPEIESFARVDDVNLTIRDAQNVIREEAAIVTDGNLFSIFDFVFEEGNPNASLNEPLLPSFIDKYVAGRC